MRVTSYQYYLLIFVVLGLLISLNQIIKFLKDDVLNKLAPIKTGPSSDPECTTTFPFTQ